jgi:hypothetical protein
MTKATPQDAAPEPVVVLSDGRTITLREPTAGELRGVKLLDVLQLDTAAHAAVIPRICELTAPEFAQLKARDTMALMSAVVGFFTPSDGSPSPSKTPGP